LENFALSIETIENEPGIALGSVLILFLAALLVGCLFSGFETGPIKPGASSALLGIYLMAWGGMFLASYYFSHKTFFLRGIAWVFEHWSYPKGRKMAFVYAAVALLGGGYVALQGFGVIKAAA
jgi:hypothetical protein